MKTIEELQAKSGHRWSTDGVCMLCDVRRVLVNLGCPIIQAAKIQQLEADLGRYRAVGNTLRRAAARFVDLNQMRANGSEPVMLAVMAWDAAVRGVE